MTIHLPSGGEYEVWADSAIPGGPPTSSTKSDKATIDLPLPVTAKKVFAWDHKSGNMISADAKSVGGGWGLTAGSLTEVALVKVHVEHEGKAVAAAQVELDDSIRVQTQLLDPSSKGDVTFFDVKPGNLKIAVKFKSGGKMADPVKQEFELKLDRADPVPSFTVSIPGDVETVGGSAATPAVSAKPSAPAAGAPAPEEKSASPFGSIITFLFGLALVGGLIYFALMYSKKNPELVQSKLEQMGVQIPKAPDDPLGDPGPMPMPIKPVAPQKIDLGGAAADLMTPVASSTVITQPRLLSTSGDSLPLDEGELLVGRDLGLGLSLAGESTVSRQHAKLVRSGNEVKVVDLGSTNGTFVNGAKVTGESHLRPGDEVRFGAVQFRFEG